MHFQFMQQQRRRQICSSGPSRSSKVMANMMSDVERTHTKSYPIQLERTLERIYRHGWMEGELCVIQFHENSNL